MMNEKTSKLVQYVIDQVGNKERSERLRIAAEKYILKRNQIQDEAKEAIGKALKEYELIIEEEKSK